MLDHKLPTKIIMGRTVRTINQDIIPKNIMNEPAKSKKIDVFTTSALVFAHDFQVCHFWTAGTAIKRRRKVVFQIQVNDDFWIRRRNQLRLRIAESNRSRHQPHFTSCWSLLNLQQIIRIRPEKELQDNRCATQKGVVESPEHFK